MNSYIESSEDEVIIKHLDGEVVAKFEGVYSGDLIEGVIDETYENKMTAADLIAIAQWLLQKAFDRACDEVTR